VNRLPTPDEIIRSDEAHAAAYLPNHTGENAQKARVNCLLSNHRASIRRLHAETHAPDPRGKLIELDCKVWGVEVTLHVEVSEDGVAWQEAWIGATNVSEWLVALPEDEVQEKAFEAWRAWRRREDDNASADRGEELKELA
jgi:hypothetical protein